MKIICIGRNYVDHARELDNPVPSRPLIFMKPESALLRDNLPFQLPSFSENVHFECELVIRFSKSFRKISESEAWNVVDAMTLGIDFTARDVQDQCKKKGHPWEIAKAFDGSAAVGAFRELSDAVKAGDEEFIMDLNGKEAQHGFTADLIFPIPFLIGYLGTYFTINPGDLLFTGTPAGVGPVKKGDLLQAWLGKGAAPANRDMQHKILDFEIQ